MTIYPHEKSKNELRFVGNGINIHFYFQHIDKYFESVLRFFTYVI